MELLLKVNGAERRFAPPLTVRELVGKLGFEGRRVAIERNGEIVPRSRYAEVELADGDRLEVVVAVGGG
ncbi:MAG TPA: sulfur carrier protein ThiS [Usitatibacteraceae bacterium]|nr:sulfur carrier protein ThiS [Usitatibacteraceae bacterium]